MPTKTSRKRIAQVAQKILTRPVPEHLTKAALARFRATGLLPDDQRLGAAVLSSVRSGIEVLQLHGERPQDSQMFEAVLVLGECNALIQNACGEDVRNLLQLYGSIATTEGDVREQHIEELVEMAPVRMFRQEDE